MLFNFTHKHNHANYLDCDELSYCSLMELFEDNYFLLKNIVEQDKELFLKDEENTSIHIQLIEQSKYTQIYKLTINNNQFFRDLTTRSAFLKEIKLGQFTLRVYNDARVAEADLATKNRSYSHNIKHNWFLNNYLNNCLSDINKLVVNNRRDKNKRSVA